MSKKYLLFAGEDYYPQGGAFDFVGVYNSKQEAFKEQLKLKSEWSNILELDGDEYDVVDSLLEEKYILKKIVEEVVNNTNFGELKKEKDELLKKVNSLELVKQQEINNIKAEFEAIIYDKDLTIARLILQNDKEKQCAKNA